MCKQRHGFPTISTLVRTVIHRLPGDTSSRFKLLWKLQPAPHPFPFRPLDLTLWRGRTNLPSAEKEDEFRARDTNPLAWSFTWQFSKQLKRKRHTRGLPDSLTGRGALLGQLGWFLTHLFVQPLGLCSEGPHAAGGLAAPWMRPWAPARMGRRSPTAMSPGDRKQPKQCPSTGLAVGAANLLTLEQPREVWGCWIKSWKILIRPE